MTSVFRYPRVGKRAGRPGGNFVCNEVSDFLTKVLFTRRRVNFVSEIPYLIAEHSQNPSKGGGHFKQKLRNPTLTRNATRNKSRKRKKNRSKTTNFRGQRLKMEQNRKKGRKNGLKNPLPRPESQLNPSTWGEGQDPTPIILGTKGEAETDEGVTTRVKNRGKREKANRQNLIRLLASEGLLM